MTDRPKLPLARVLAGRYHCHVRCRGCGRYGFLRHEALDRLAASPETSMSRIEARLRCRQCGHRGAETWLCTPALPFTAGWRDPRESS